MQRILSLCAVVLLAAATAFASPQSEAAGKAAGGDRLKAIGFHATGLPITDQKVTVRATIIRPPYAPVPYDQMTVIKDLEQKSNVNVVFDELAQTQAQERSTSSSRAGSSPRSWSTRR